MIIKIKTDFFGQCRFLYLLIKILFIIFSVIMLDSRLRGNDTKKLKIDNCRLSILAGVNPEHSGPE